MLYLSFISQPITKDFKRAKILVPNVKIYLRMYASQKARRVLIYFLYGAVPLNRAMAAPALKNLKEVGGGDFDALLNLLF